MLLDQPLSRTHRLGTRCLQSFWLASGLVWHLDWLCLSLGVLARHLYEEIHYDHL